MTDKLDGKRMAYDWSLRTTIALAAFLVGGYLAYTAHTVYRTMPRDETGTVVDPTEHLIVIGNVGLHPLVPATAIGVAAALFVAVGVYLIVVERE